MTDCWPNLHPDTNCRRDFQHFHIPTMVIWLEHGLTFSKASGFLYTPLNNSFTDCKLWASTLPSMDRTITSFCSLITLDNDPWRKARHYPDVLNSSHIFNQILYNDAFWNFFHFILQAKKLYCFQIRITNF